MSAFTEFRSEVLDGVKDLATTTLAGFANQAKSDTQQFLTNQKTKLTEWGDQLKAGEIDADDYEFNVGGLLDLAEMHALTEVGITAGQIQHFRDGLIKLVVDAAVKHFVPI